MGLITLSEYAKKNGLGESSTRLKASCGKFRTAIKIGKCWLIDENEPVIDHRVKSGKYRKKKTV